MLSSFTIDGVSRFEMGVQFTRNILIEFSDIFSFLGKHLNSKKLVFIDSIVLANQREFLSIESFDPNLILVPTNLNEANKNIESLMAILSVMESNGIGRKGDLVMAVGGGTLLDTVALAASIFRRGIEVVKVPTTLLGIVDAAIGIKTGINYKGQRNRIGSYHFDYSVIIDPKLMKGLRRGLIRQGLGEIFKIAIIKSKELFDLIILHRSSLEDYSFYQSDEGHYLLALSIRLMLEELHNNPREDNLMRCVDFGHSFSPLVEMESIKRVGIKTIPHGYSVAYDCLLTSAISCQRGNLHEDQYREILNLFLSFDFGLKNEIYIDCNLLWASFTEMTKHRGGNQNLPIPISIGAYTYLQDVTFEEVQDCSRLLQKFINQ